MNNSDSSNEAMVAQLGERLPRNLRSMVPIPETAFACECSKLFVAVAVPLVTGKGKRRDGTGTFKDVRSFWKKA